MLTRTTRPDVLHGPPPVVAYMARLRSPSSVPVVRRALQRAVSVWAPGVSWDVYPWHQVTAVHLDSLRNALTAEGLAPATINRHLAACRGVLRACWRAGLLDRDKLERSCDVAPAVGSRVPRGRALQGVELSRLLGGIDTTNPRGIRDLALLALAYGCGLRRAELVGLAVGAWDRAGNVLIVRGKGNKERRAWPPAPAAAALSAWLQLRGDDLDPASPLFVRVRKGGHVSKEPMTPQAVWKILQARAGQAGLDRVSPHDLRRSFVSDLLDLCHDLSLVAGLAGHASTTTTQRYDRRGDDDRQRLALRLQVPMPPLPAFPMPSTVVSRRKARA